MLYQALPEYEFIRQKIKKNKSINKIYNNKLFNIKAIEKNKKRILQKQKLLKKPNRFSTQRQLPLVQPSIINNTTTKKIRSLIGLKAKKNLSFPSGGQKSKLVIVISTYYKEKNYYVLTLRTN